MQSGSSLNANDCQNFVLDVPISGLSFSTADNPSGTATQSSDDVTVVDSAISSDVQSPTTSNGGEFQSAAEHTDQLQPIVVVAEPTIVQAASAMHDDGNNAESACALKTFSDILSDSIDKSPFSNNARRKSKKRSVAHAAVVTSSPYKANLEGQVSDNMNVKSKGQHSNTSTVGTRKRKRPSETSAKPVSEKKPKTVKQSASSESAGTSTMPTVTPQHDETPCLYCDIRYCDSNVKWVRCCRCKLWACCGCAHVGKGKRQYICDTCR